MRNILKVILGVAVFAFLVSFVRPTPVFALEAETCSSANIIGPNFRVSGMPGINPQVVYNNTPYSNAVIRFQGLVPNIRYRIECVVDGYSRVQTPGEITTTDGVYDWTLGDDSACFSHQNDFDTFDDSTVNAYFRVTTFNSSGSEPTCVANPYEIKPVSEGATCSFNVVKQSGTGLQGCFQPGDQIEWSATVSYANGSRYNREVYWHITNIQGGGLAIGNTLTADQMAANEGVITDTGTVAAAGQKFKIEIYENLPGFLNVSSVKKICEYESTAPVQAVCTDEQRLESPPPTNTPGSEQITAFSLCRQIPILTPTDIENQLRSVPDDKKQQVGQDLYARATKQAVEKAKCCQCAFGTSAVDPDTGACADELDPGYRPRAGFKPGIYTSLGCIGASSETIVTQLVRIGLGIAGGVALLMILAGAFIFSTSQGEPKKASEAKELITSAVLGLIFIIFSVTILQFIGVTILRIPGFGQ